MILIDIFNIDPLLATVSLENPSCTNIYSTHGHVNLQSGIKDKAENPMLLKELAMQFLFDLWIWKSFSSENDSCVPILSIHQEGSGDCSESLSSSLAQSVVLLSEHRP